MLIKEDTELRVPIWHSGTREALLIHVGSACEAIKKKGYSKSFEDHSEDYSEKREKVKELKKQLEALKEALASQPQEKAPKETGGNWVFSSIYMLLAMAPSHDTGSPLELQRE